MTKEKIIAAPLPVAVEAPPRQAAIGKISGDVASRLRVLDAETGGAIEKVIAYDMDAGTVTRYLVEGGNLVRRGDVFATVTEERQIRVEWIDAA